MKYKINNKYLVDAKSPLEAAKAIRMVKQVVKDSISEIAKNYNYKTIESNVDNVNYICKLKDDCKYDMKTAVKLQSKLQANGFNAKLKAPDIYVYDSKCEDDYQKYISPDRKYYVILDGTWGEITNVETQETIWSGRYTGGSAKQLLEDWKKSNSIKDESETEYLSKEEEQAIEDYRNAISKTKDPKLLKIYAHILKEETEHLEELQNEELVDSCETKKD